VNAEKVNERAKGIISNPDRDPDVERTGRPRRADPLRITGGTLLPPQMPTRRSGPPPGSIPRRTREQPASGFTEYVETIVPGERSAQRGTGAEPISRATTSGAIVRANSRVCRSRGLGLPCAVCRTHR
jgi:hypothetical protein